MKKPRRMMLVIRRGLLVVRLDNAAVASGAILETTAKKLPDRQTS